MVMTTVKRPAKRQHKKPCHDCPWRRKAIAGWLGGTPAKTWVLAAHADGVIECHTRDNAMQCAGSAVYRANVCKTSRDPTVLRLPEDHESVFSTPFEFLAHHAPVKS